MMKPVAFGLIFFGMLLLVLSGLWINIFPGTSRGLPRKPAVAKIKDRLHNLGFVVGSPSARVGRPQRSRHRTAKAEYDRLRIESDVYAAEFN